MKNRPEDQYQALWAVNPDVPIEGARVLPQPGHLRVPPFVGRERRAPERDAYEDRERHRRERSDRWGPPRPDLDRRALLVAGIALTVTLGLALFAAGLSLTPDRYLLVLLVPAVVLGTGRRYLADFVPFAVLMLAYSEVRGLAHVVRPAAYVLPQLHLERYLFHGVVPTVQLQQWLWHGTLQWYDRALLDVMKIHSVVPAALAFVLWLNRRALFYRFAATMISLSFGAAVIFWIFPAAPPWDAGLRGLLPVTKITAGSAVPLPSQYTLNHFIDGNPNAAIPSLHAGYAFLIYLFVVTLSWRTRWRWFALGVGALYPALQSFAVVYTANHYVVDLFLGYAWAAAALFAVQWFWRRRGWPE
jgi:hypothetical protein